MLKGDGGRDTEREVRTSLTDFNARLRPIPHGRLSFRRGPMKIRMRLLDVPPLAPDQPSHKRLSGIYRSQDLPPQWYEPTALTWRSKFHSASLKRFSVPTFGKFPPPHLPPGAGKLDPLHLQSNIFLEDISSCLAGDILYDAPHSPCTPPSPCPPSRKPKSPSTQTRT